MSVRAEALGFATFTFSNKASTGLAARVTGLMLATVGYVANQPQTPIAIDGIFSLVTLLPALSALLSIVPLFYYRQALAKLGKLPVQAG